MSLQGVGVAAVGGGGGIGKAPYEKNWGIFFFTLCKG